MTNTRVGRFILFFFFKIKMNSLKCEVHDEILLERKQKILRVAESPVLFKKKKRQDPLINLEKPKCLENP